MTFQMGKSYMGAKIGEIWVADSPVYQLPGGDKVMVVHQKGTPSNQCYLAVIEGPQARVFRPSQSSRRITDLEVDA